MSEVSLKALRQSLRQAGIQLSPAAPPFLCAVSGGLDSMVLVHLLKQLGVPLRAIHVDHAVHTDSAKWAKWVSGQLESIDVSVQIYRLEEEIASGSLEEYWRNARRKLFAHELREGEILVTAHHQSDQVETLLLQLLRGAGPVGLQAMASCSRLHPHGYHVRPLLACTRQELEHFAHREGIAWLDDPSNTDERFERNFLRHTILPQLYERWPGAGTAMARSLALIAESVALNEVLAVKDSNLSDDGHRLDWSALAPLDSARQANAVRFWLRSCKVRLPNRRRLAEALRQWNEAGEDKLPTLTLAEGAIQRYRSQLVFAPTQLTASHGWFGTLKPGGWLPLPGDYGSFGWRCEPELSDPARRVEGLRVSSALSASQPLTVRFRQKGEKLRRGAGYHQRLKHWFQNNGVPPILRNRTPLVFSGEELIAIADIWIDARFRPDKDSSVDAKEYRLIWRKPASDKAK